MDLCRDDVPHLHAYVPVSLFLAAGAAVYPRDLREKFHPLGMKHCGLCSGNMLRNKLGWRNSAKQAVRALLVRDQTTGRK
jgi:hypothetical protein